MTKNVKSIFLVATLLFLLVGVSAISASEVSDDSTNIDVDDTPVLTEDTTPTSTDNTPVEASATEIKKEKTNLKTSSKTVEVNDYTELISSINSASSDSENDNYVISLNEGTYQLTQYGTCNSGTSKPNITIEANNQILSTQPNTAYYVMLNNGCNITINDATITHRLFTQTNLELNNVIVNSSQLEVYPTATLTLKNSTINGLISNGGTVIFADDCIFGENFQITGNGEFITNDTDKIAPYLPIYNGNYVLENLTIENSKTNNGNLSLINCTINTSIYNTGILNISDDCIIGEYASFSGNGSIIINDLNRILPYLSTYYEDYTLENMTLTTYYRANYGNLTIINSNIPCTIENNGNLTIKTSNITDTIYNNEFSLIDDSNITGYYVNNRKYSIINNSVITGIITNNNANISFENTLLNCEIQNQGLMIFDDDCTFGNNFRLTGNGQIVINDTSKIAAFLDTYTGNITLENMTITTGSKTNYGNLTIKNSTVSYIYNLGNITIINSNITTLDMGAENVSITIINSTITNRINFNGYGHSTISLVNSTSRVDGTTDVNMTIINSHLTFWMNFGH